MPKDDYELERLASMLDLLLDGREQGAVDSESVDQLQQELRAMGFEPARLLEQVGPAVTRLLESVGVEVATDPSNEAQEPAADALPSTIIARSAVEPSMPAAPVAMASPIPSAASVRRLVARNEALELFSVEPRLHLIIDRTRSGYTLVLALEPRTDPERPDRPVARRGGRIQVHLRRPDEKRSIDVTLLPRLSQRVPLPGYATDEESRWEITFTIHMTKLPPDPEDVRL